MIIVGLSGYGKAGKDTVGAFLASHGFKRYAFADALKDLLVRLDPVVGIHQKTGKPWLLSMMIEKHGSLEACKHHPEITRLMQRLGTEAGREGPLGEDVWVNAVFRKINQENPERVVITDLRFPNEAEAIEAAGGFLWRINRKGQGPKTAPDGTVHKSETLLDDYPDIFDVVIDNDEDLPELKAKVDHLVQVLFGDPREGEQE